MSKVISEKSTKIEILEAYQQALSALETKQSTTFDPTAQATEIKKKEVISKVESVNTNDLQSLVNEVTSKVATLSEKLDVFKQADEAISIKKNEIKQMFDIETSAYSLSALVNSQAELKEKFTIEMKEKEAELKKLVDETNLQLSNAKQTTLTDIKKINDDAKLARKKDEETYEYETDRARKMAKDKFNDELAVKTKEYDAKIKDLVVRENSIKTLESTIESLKLEMAEAVKTSTDSATSKAKTAYTFETNYLKKDYEGKINLLDSKIDTLTQALADSKSTISTLTSKLDEAYAKIENMAKATIEGSNSKDMISTLKNALSDKGNSGK